MRFILRIFAFLSLAVAVISAVVDISRSLAASTLVLTSLQKGWSDVAPASLAAVQLFLQEKLPAFVHDPVFIFLLNMPAAAIFVVLAVLFYAVGAKREKPFGQIQIR